MESVAYLDTHAVVWLYYEAHLLSARAKAVIDQSELYISPMVLLELQYLREVGRVENDPLKIFGVLSRTIGLKVCSKSFSPIAEAAIDFSWARDPFDRMIVAQASLDKNSLITKDESIRKHYAYAVW